MADKATVTELGKKAAYIKTCTLHHLKECEPGSACEERCQALIEKCDEMMELVKSQKLAGYQ